MIAWLDVVVHMFNPSSYEAEAGRTREFEAGPVFIKSSRLAKLHYGDLVLKTKTMKTYDHHSKNNC